MLINAAPYLVGGMHTLKVKNQLHIKQGYDLALSLANVYIALHRINLLDLHRIVSLLHRESDDVLDKVFPCPVLDIFVDPMPIIGIVEDHLYCSPAAVLSMERLKPVQPLVTSLENATLCEEFYRRPNVREGDCAPAKLIPIKKSTSLCRTGAS